VDGAGLCVGFERAVLVALVVAPSAEFIEGGGFAGFAEADWHCENWKRRNGVAR